MFPRSRVLPLAIAALALVVAGIAFLLLGSGDDEPSTAVAGPSPEPSATVQAATPEPGATPPIPGTGPDHRIVIEKANVDAPITHVVVSDAGGTLPSPETSDDVVFYDFSNHERVGGFPGVFGNSIFAGHVDSGHKPCKNGTVPPPCEAVFWDLTELEEGDIIEVHLGPEFVFRYSVTSIRNIDAADAATWAGVWPSTAEETITLITCSGNFNRDTGEYTSRHVVSGIRVQETASAPQ